MMPKPKHKPITAAELVAEMHANLDWVRRDMERRRKRAAMEARDRVEEAHLLADLRNVGWDLNSVWDLVNTREPYPEAVPVLLKHLGRDYSDPIRDGIARALGVRAARYAWPELIAHWRTAPEGTRTKDGLGVAVACAALPEDVPALIDLAYDTSLGSSRIFLLRPLMRSRNPKAREALEALADDPQLEKEIAAWKKRRRQKSK